MTGRLICVGAKSKLERPFYEEGPSVLLPLEVSNGQVAAMAHVLPASRGLYYI